MEQKASMETPLFLRMKDRKKNNHEKVIRYKTTEHVQNRKHKRDEDGFFVPVAMFRPYTGEGLLCEVLGKTRSRQLADLKAQREYLMKEAYEHAIERMMCLVRLRELDSHKRIVHGKREEDVLHYYSEVNEQGSTTGVEKTVSEMSEPEKRRAIFNTITWQYDWIQQNKKRCFQFAEAVIDCKIVANQKPCTLFVCENGFFRYEDRRMKPRGTNLEDQKRFMEEFIREAAALPELNRALLDIMYEMAWYILFEYWYDCPQRRVPAPWYDEVGCADKTEQQDAPAMSAEPTVPAEPTDSTEPAKHSEITKPDDTHEEGRDGESS